MNDPWLWKPGAALVESANVMRLIRSLRLRTCDDLRQYSRDHLEVFWDLMVRTVGIDWFEPYSAVLDTSAGVEWSRWFEGGKLNIAWNCLDRHAAGPAASHIACIWEDEDQTQRILTFAELHREVNLVANGLRALGLNQGDRVALYMPMVPEVIVILYACLKLGLIAVPIFSGFGFGAAATRLADSGARVLFTADSMKRRGRLLPLKEKADLAAAKAGTLEKVIVYRYQGTPVTWNDSVDMWWDDLVRGHSSECCSLPLDSETPAMLLYTSGTTGRPKGAVHTHAGALAQVTKEIYLAFDHQPGDRFFWVSDIGWMMGPWAIIGNHHFGGTVVLYDGAPDYPRPDQFCSLIERQRVNTFGISPTAIRVLMRHGCEAVEGHDLSSLRLLGSTGEPWDETSWLWFFEKIGGKRCPIINISGGTEIIGCLLFPLPIERLKPCSLGGPAPGMATDIFDDQGCPVRGKAGNLVCTKPAPSMTRGLWNAPERYLAAYWSRWKGVWDHGDSASTDEDGCWFIYGRADEALNVAGRKVGPAEIEEALIEHPAVSEAAVVGVPDEITGEAIVAFVVPARGSSFDAGVAREVCAHVAKSLGSMLRPVSIYAVEELPKTQSGKTVRRLIRQAFLGEELGDVSTVEKPGILSQFRRI
jgi:acetyl-CoA synthetase